MSWFRERPRAVSGSGGARDRRQRQRRVSGRPRDALRHGRAREMPPSSVRAATLPHRSVLFVVPVLAAVDNLPLMTPRLELLQIFLLRNGAKLRLLIFMRG